ncbi:unnamed protein product [Arabidopsis halleri]
MEAVPPINKCSGTDELASSWFCSEWDISGKGFETCFGHLKTHALEEELGFKKLSDLLPLVYSSDEILSEETTMKDLQFSLPKFEPMLSFLTGCAYLVFKEAIDSTLSEYLERYKETDDYHAGVTAVLWDIKRCPVPPDCDARLVGPCITRYFEDLGYSGPITIYAFGQLTDVPDDVLRAVSSTGISLNHITFKTDSADIMHLMARWTCLNPRPATIMFICPYSKVSKNDMNHLEEKWGCHVIKQFTYDSPGSQSYFGNFLRLEDDSGTLAENKCSETGEHASWACLVCNISGKGFENFTMHLKTHALEEGN